MGSQNIESKIREVNFFNQLSLSENTFRSYRAALKSVLLKDVLFKFCNCISIFEITDLDKLWNVYSFLNIHPKNVSSHRCYSAVVMKYIRFLNDGKKYGKRIDYGRKKVKIDKND